MVRKMTKSKRLLFGGTTLLLMIWCTKGYWNSNPNAVIPIPSGGKVGSSALSPFSMAFNDDRGAGAPLTPSAAQQAILERDKLINQLRIELSNLGRGCSVKPSPSSKSLPIIYAITPTYARPVQKAELTRLSHTLMLVPNLHWVIVEDAAEKSDLVAKLLERSGIPYTHLNAQTPATWKLRAKEPRYNKPRGVLQRNTALEWLREEFGGKGREEVEGVVYFADDDNAYSLEVFEEMRWVKRVGVWPVGLVGGLMVERPKVGKGGRVEGWLTMWSPKRPFAIDMAGFAVNLGLFLERKEGRFAYEVEKGYQESEFLRWFVKDLGEVEAKADNCTKVYVWHTRTENPPLREEIALRKLGKPRSDQGIEV